MKRLFATALGGLVLCAPLTAHAQGFVIDGLVGATTGMEGGSPGTGGVAWHRARTRAVVGVELGVDERGYDAFGFRSFVELERTVTLGGSLHYTRWLAPAVGVYGGLTGVIAPKTMAGLDAGMLLVIPFSKKVGIFIEPEIAALPVGSDVPDDSVVVWGLVSLGLKLTI